MERTAVASYVGGSSRLTAAAGRAATSAVARKIFQPRKIFSR
jgi:hypothetical protein